MFTLVAVAISVGPNHKADKRAGIPKVNDWAIPQIVCASMATANRSGLTAAHFRIAPIAVSKAPSMHESRRPLRSSKNMAGKTKGM